MNKPETPVSAKGLDICAVTLDALPHPVITVDAESNILTTNLAGEHFFQSSSAYICKRRLDYFIPFGSPVLTLINQARDERTVINEYKIDVSSPRLGRDRLVDVYAAPIPEIEGGVAVQFFQRTMAEKIDRQLTHRGAARTVTGLAAMLAHEIKNPLSGIRGAAQLLEMAADNEDDRSLTQLIKDETDRIVKLVDRMEVFSDERPIEAEPVNIHVVLEHVKKIAQNGFARGITIHENYDPSLPPVMGNRDQLVQTFLNLVKNAAEAVAGRESPEITFSTAFRHGIHLTVPGASKRVALPLELTVSDNGPGIAEDVRHYIFDPFVTTKTNGSGLGLALVAKIVGNHGGIVECDSSENGTTFRILLPVYSSDEKHKPTHEAETGN
ncbi:MAG: two-component sensor histidine kinase [Nitratireductor sp.]|nr:two-component sensor histidine kinase [Nitratireductor sp.]MCC0019561.1 two-component sensor histidine kinase [Nitratireductor sp.]